jgi:hypothetical protein
VREEEMNNARPEPEEEHGENTDQNLVTQLVPEYS